MLSLNTLQMQQAHPGVGAEVPESLNYAHLDTSHFPELKDDAGGTLEVPPAYWWYLLVWWLFW